MPLIIKISNFIQDLQKKIKNLTWPENPFLLIFFSFLFIIGKSRLAAGESFVIAAADDDDDDDC